MGIKKGFMTALITPFDEEFKVDFATLKTLVKDQLDKGVEGFIISGTTAESPNLSNLEVEKIYTSIKELVPKDFQLILGVGTNSTFKTIKKIKDMEYLEPDGYLVVTPYYNKPTQEGLRVHFSEIAKATSKDILLYDVPGRTVTEISVETVVKLSEIKNIVGIKDATGNMNKIRSLREKTNKDFLIFSGDDGTACEFMSLGGDGVVSVLSHVIPEEFKKCLNRKESFTNYKKLCELLFCEPNPTPVKHALHRMGILKSNVLRLPLLKMSEANAQKLDKELAKLGITQDA